MRDIIVSPLVQQFKFLLCLALKYFFGQQSDKPHLEKLDFLRKKLSVAHR